jgi:putative ABC transport system substrate-binding protein
MARHPGVEDAFPRGLQDLGYVEGRSVSIEWRSADGRGVRLSPLAAELVQLGVDVIVAAGPEARVAAMWATSTIPIVVVGGAAPVTEGWAGSLARPGGHVTGFTVTHPEMRAKKLEFLQEMIPGLSHVGELRDGGASVAMRISASNPGVDLRVIDVRLPADFDRAFRQAILDRRQALIVVETAMVSRTGPRSPRGR